MKHRQFYPFCPGSKFAAAALPMSYKRCPNCRSLKVHLAVETGQFIYFRCSDCVEVWSIPERRDTLRAMTDPALERDRAERRRLRYAVH